jgi:hypothetical protein
VSLPYSCMFEPEGNACSLTDSTAEEHVLALVEHAADEARDRINRFLPGGKVVPGACLQGCGRLASNTRMSLQQAQPSGYHCAITRVYPERHLGPVCTLSQGHLDQKSGQLLSLLVSFPQKEPRELCWQGHPEHEVLCVLTVPRMWSGPAVSDPTVSLAVPGGPARQGYTPFVVCHRCPQMGGTSPLIQFFMCTCSSLRAAI